VLLTLIFIAHLMSTVFMTGVIWFVQVVHYPLFAGVGVSEFSNYERLHCKLVAWIVIPAMLVELLTALILPFLSFSLAPQLLYGNMFLILLTWLTTFVLQVPAHRKLSIAFDETTHQSLVRSNWIRTLLWSSRAALLVVLLSRFLQLN
jgi:hypothetical protein